MVDQRSWKPKEALGMDLPVGHIHAHHYARREGPPEDVVDGSSCEFVPSVVTQALCAPGFDESINVIPIS